MGNMSTKGQRRLALFGSLSLILGLCLGVLVMLVNDDPSTADSLVKVGQAKDFPPHSVTALSLPVTFWDPDPPAILGETPGRVTQMPQAPIEPVLIWLVHSAENGYLALYRRDPYLGCQIAWEEINQRFVNPCHGQKYTKTGEWIEGQSERNLDRFAVVVNDAGELWVDIRRYQVGKPLPVEAASSYRP
jgi:nitrite reductase/ring-hydroxylating ferredoxin subunit